MSNWNKISDVSGIAGSYKEDPESDVRVFKVDFYIDKPPKDVARYVCMNYTELSLEISPQDFDHFVLLHKHDENIRSHHCVAKGIGPVAARELITSAVFIELGGESYADCTCSVDNGMPVREGCVRAEMLCGLQLFEPAAGDDQRTHVQVLAQLDVKGSIPKWIVNQVMAAKAGFYVKLRDKLNERA